MAVESWRCPSRLSAMESTLCVTHFLRRNKKDEAPRFYSRACSAHRRIAKRPSPKGLEAARRSQHECRRSRCCWCDQVCSDGLGFPCDEPKGGRLLESSQYSLRKLHAQRYVQVD